jgi:hypothetical protein
MVLVWLKALAKGSKVAVYCSDVAGAFDRVSKERLCAKLKSKKIHPLVLKVLFSWLRSRRACVVVGGEKSEDFDLADMVFQGTVWGPPLWNIFYEDARKAIQELFFTEIVYADDLNSFRLFPSSVPNNSILKSISMCQKELHEWGRANQVTFDPKKESVHILSKTDAYGPEFKILGVTFDSALTMASCVEEVVNAARWKLKMLLRTKRYYTDAELVTLYKAHLLSYLEYRTPAIYHATRDVLERLDRVQTNFLQDAGISDVVALMEFNLAPLAARRDMAMLGLIHRTVIGKGPNHFKDHFKISDGMCLHDPRSSDRGQLITRSALGLVAVYNLLPRGITSARDVKSFQTRLQMELTLRAEAGAPDWDKTYSPRGPLHRHPLLQNGSGLLKQRVLDSFFDTDSD